MSDGTCARTGQAAAWVLGTLSADEAERFSAHLEVCVVCREEVVRLRGAVDALADTAPPAAPPAELRERVMAAVEEEAALFRAADEVERAPHPARTHRRTRRASRAVLGGGIALLAVGLGLGAAAGGLLSSSSQDERRGEVARTLVGSVTEDGGGVRARAAVVIRGRVAQLVLTDLAPPPRGRVYQAWVLRVPSRAEPTGALFSVPRSGDTRISLPSLRGAERVIVTAEPPRGSRTPTPPPRVVVGLAR